MKIVIDIPDEDYKGVCHLKNEQLRMLPEEVAETLIQIMNGTPLPKGHGRLIDADAELEGLRKMKVVDEKDKQSVRFAIIEYENAPTIIEADEGEEE